MKLRIRDRIKLFRHGLKIAQSKDWFIVWDKKTGIPVNYSLPFVTELNKDYKNTIFHDWLDSVKVSDYRRPFMTEEEVKAFNEETKQHLKEKLKKVNEEIQKNKDKPVNFPKGDIEYKNEVDNEIK